MRRRGWCVCIVLSQAACGEVARPLPDVVYSTCGTDGCRARAVSLDGDDAYDLGSGDAPKIAPTFEVVAMLEESQGYSSPLSLVDTRTGQRTRVGDPVYAPLEWSPDGSQVAFVEHTDPPALRVCAADGGGCRTVSQGGETVDDLAWSAESSFIAYASSSVLRVVRADGESHRTIHESSAAAPLGRAANGLAIWAPIGARLAFVAGTGIFVWDESSGATVQIAETDAVKPMIQWSPDGAHVGVAEPKGLVVAAADGGSSQAVVDAAIPSPSFWYHWSWSARRILYIHEATDDQGAPIDALSVFDVDAGTTLRLASVPSDSGATIRGFWSPAGDRIVYTVRGPSSSEVHLVGSGGQQDHPVFAATAQSVATWSPAGDRLLVWESTTSTAVVLRLDGSVEGSFQGSSYAWLESGEGLCAWSAQRLECARTDGSSHRTLWTAPSEADNKIINVHVR